MTESRGTSRVRTLFMSRPPWQRSHGKVKLFACAGHLVLISYYSNSRWQSKARHSLSALTYNMRLCPHAQTHKHGYCVWSRLECLPSSCLNVLFAAMNLESKSVSWPLTDGIRRNALQHWNPLRWNDWLPLYHSCNLSMQVSGKTAAAFHYYSPVISHQPYRIKALPGFSLHMLTVYLFYTCSSEMWGRVQLIHHVQYMSPTGRQHLLGT